MARRLTWLPVAIVFLLVLAVSACNYRPATFLTGWDNLHSEFAPALNIKRTVFSVWQEYQGLGLLAGMGHGADLFRQLFLTVLVPLLPLSQVRYFFHFLMLFLGPLGVYFLVKEVILEKHRPGEKVVGGLGGSFFYLFNLATLQMFFVPYEAFSSHFGFLPWLFLVGLNFWQKPSKRNLIFLLAVNILALAQGYVATFFLVYFFSLSLVSFFWWRRQPKHWRRILLSLAIILAVNAFWLLPNLYFVFNDAKVNLRAKINLMSTEENLLRNKKYGNLAEAALLKGFWFDNLEQDENGQVNFQLGEWQAHLKSPFILGLGYLLFIFCLAGGWLALRKKERAALLFLPVLLLGFSFLANDTPGVSFLVQFFYRLPLFSQAFRFPFTKFSLLTALSLAIFYALFLAWLWRPVKKSAWRLSQRILAVLILPLPLVFLFPVFQGKLFSQKERLGIPEEYFQLFDFFAREDPNSRIANFPQGGFWGWDFYRWHYSGSGFLWYGISQPILDRAFDVWGSQNENYFWEVSYALFSRREPLFEKILEKYQINWLVVDENVINAGGSWSLGTGILEEMLSSPKFVLAGEFGKIKVYRVNSQLPQENFVFLAQNLPTVGPEYKWNNFDRAYLEKGNYFSSPASHPSVYYPFRSLFTGRTGEDLDFVIEEKEGYFIFRKDLPPAVADYRWQMADFNGQELIWVDPNNLAKMHFLIPEVRFNGKSLEVWVPKVDGYFSGRLKPADSALKGLSCTPFEKGEVKDEVVFQEGQNALRLIARDANNCSAVFSLNQLPHKFAYLFRVKNHYVLGKSLLFWLENLGHRRSDMELYLPKEAILTYLIQPPMARDGLGYSLHFDNIAVGRQESINDLQEITVNPIPFDFLTGLVLVPRPEVETLPVSFEKPAAVWHPNPTVYEVEVPATESGTLVLSQAYHPGWKAYLVKSKVKSQKSKVMSFLAPVLGKEIKEHVLVNNWENGWKLDSLKIKNSKLKIVLVFLPQYLQYLGFGLLGVALIWVVASAKRPPSKVSKQFSLSGLWQER